MKTELRFDESDYFNNLIENLQSEVEMRKSLFLNVLFRNVDILMENTGKWFGSEVPSEYSQVVNSLVHLSVSYLEEVDGFVNALSEDIYEVFAPGDIIKGCLESFGNMIKPGKKTFESQGTPEINTSSVLLKDSVNNIFLSMAPYINDNSELSVSLKEGKSDVLLDISFSGLSDDLPETNKLLKLFYSVKIDEVYRIRIGLSLPVENLKRIGAIVKFTRNTDGINVNVRFPSVDFLKTVDDIRKHYAERSLKKKEGLVYLSISDRITEMFLFDNLSDLGYVIKNIKTPAGPFADSPSDSTFLITDFERILSSYDDVLSFCASIEGKKIIVIERENDVIPVECGKMLSVVKFPFEIETIAELMG